MGRELILGTRRGVKDLRWVKRDCVRLFFVCWLWRVKMFYVEHYLFFGCVILEK